MTYDWQEDGHSVWYEDGYGLNLEHPRSCMKTEQACPHRPTGERVELLSPQWRPAAPRLHTDEDCPDPERWTFPDCALQYEHDAVGMMELYQGDLATLERSLSRDPDNPSPIRYWHEQQHTPSTPMGPEEWWTECGWELVNEAS